MNKTDQRSRTHFFSKYGGLCIYYIDMKKRCKIDHREIIFVKEDGYALIGNPDNPDRTSTDHEYFSFVMI